MYDAPTCTCVSAVVSSTSSRLTSIQSYPPTVLNGPSRWICQYSSSAMATLHDEMFCDGSRSSISVRLGVLLRTPRSCIAVVAQRELEVCFSRCTAGRVNQSHEERKS